jgi:hypothetical protein
MESIINFLSTPFFEEYNKWLGLAGLILGVALFIVYNRAVFLNYGWLKSISISYYSVKPHWLFKWFMWGCVLSILCIGQNMMYAIACGFFAIMTWNPTIERGGRFFIPHMIGAITAITLCILGTYILFHNSWVIWTTVVVLVAVIIKLRKAFNLVYWIEISTLSCLMIGFIVFIFKQII